jgi:tetratricopeptide (TPR) repeat protein
LAASEWTRRKKRIVPPARGEGGKRTVQLASVIGRQFLVRLLERVAGLTGKLEMDNVSRYRWHIPLLYARGALELARGHHDEAAQFATEALELARRTHSRKHEAPALRLPGEVLAATGRLKDSVPILEASVALAHDLKVPRDEWLGALALGKLLMRLGKDKEAEHAFTGAAETIESVASALKTEPLIRSFATAPRVIEVFRALGRIPPLGKPPSAR